MTQRFLDRDQEVTLAKYDIQICDISPLSMIYIGYAHHSSSSSSSSSGNGKSGARNERISKRMIKDHAVTNAIISIICNNRKEGVYNPCLEQAHANSALHMMESGGLRRGGRFSNAALCSRFSTHLTSLVCKHHSNRVA